MRVDVDEDTGRVRVDTEAFDALVASATGARGPGGPVADLLASGAVDPLLSAVRAPSVRWWVTVAGEEKVRRHEGWATSGVAALRLAVTADEHQLVAVEPQFVPAGLARVVHLGPRKVGARTPRTVPGVTARDLFDADERRRTRALRALEVSFAWSLAVDGDRGRADVTVVDGPLGPFLVTDVGTGSPAVELRPVSPTQLWRSLVDVGWP